LRVLLGAVLLGAVRGGARRRIVFARRRGRLGVGLLLGLLAGVVVETRLLGEQGLPIGDRNPVIVGMNLAERQETVAVAAVFDEGRLQGGFDPRDLGEVDVSLELRPCS
jgi:hypothetical protein